MKVPHSSERRGRGVMEVNMTPMIDMVFLLIVYFIWTSSDTALELLLPSRISEQAGAAATSSDDIPPPAADFEPVVVRLASTPAGVSWRVNDQPLASLVELRGVLENLARIKRDAPVILHPDGQVPLGDVIDVYDLSRVIGFEQVQFTAAE